MGLSLQPILASGESERRKTARVKAWLAAYEGQAQGNATEAARMAGYRHPEQAGYELRKKWSSEVEAIDVKVRDAKKLKDEELEAIPSEIARATHVKEQDRLKAVELVARLRGKLNDKLAVTVSRGELMKQLDDAMGVLVQVSRTTSPTLVDETIRSITGNSGNSPEE